MEKSKGRTQDWRRAKEEGRIGTEQMKDWKRAKERGRNRARKKKKLRSKAK